MWYMAVCAERRATLLFEIGQISEETLGDKPRAVESYKQILEINAKDGEAARRLEALYDELGRPDERSAILESLIEQGATNPQLVDDLLDYSSSTEAMGKNVGDDLAEGKPTLPLIHAMQHASVADRDLLSGAIRSGGLDKINEVMAIIKSTDSLDYTSQRATAEAEKAKTALFALPASVYKEAMITLADFSVQRAY